MGQDESPRGRGLSSGAFYKACARLLSLPEPIVVVPGVVYNDGTTVVTTWLLKRQDINGFVNDFGS